MRDKVWDLNTIEEMAWRYDIESVAIRKLFDGKEIMYWKA